MAHATETDRRRHQKTCGSSWATANHHHPSQVARCNNIVCYLRRKRTRNSPHTVSRLISGGGKLKIKHSVTGKWTLVSSSQQRNGAAAGGGFLRWLVVKWKVPCGFGRQRLRQHASDMCLLHTAATTTARKYVLNAVVCIVVCHTNGSPRNATHN